MKYLMPLLGVLVASACLANVIRVPEDFTILQSAIDQTIVGDTILVDENFSDNVFSTITHPITIISDSFVPKLQIRPNIHGLIINAGDVSYVNLLGLNIKIVSADNSKIVLDFGNSNGIINSSFSNCDVRIENYTYVGSVLNDDVDFLNCNVVISNCLFRGNEQFNQRNRLLMFDNTVCNIVDTSIMDNRFLDNAPGSVIISNSSNVTMRNVVLLDLNTVYYSGIIVSNSNLFIDYSFVYFCNLEGTSFSIGVNNVNGIDTSVNGSGWPTAGSTLIDAGDPSLPNDPDGTRSDIGVHFFCQGEGVHLPDIVRTSAEPGYPEQLTATLQSSCDPVQIDSAKTTTGLFTLQSYPSQVAGEFKTGEFQLTFHPSVQGAFTDTLHIWADTDPPHHKIPLVGESGPIPAPVTDLSINILPDLSAQLTWSPVTSTIYGNPVTPDYYLIFYNELDPQVEEEWYYQGAVATPGYLHFMVARFADLMNYRVVAWKGIDPAFFGIQMGMRLSEISKGLNFN